MARRFARALAHLVLCTPSPVSEANNLSDDGSTEYELRRKVTPELQQLAQALLFLYASSQPNKRVRHRSYCCHDLCRLLQAGPAAHSTADGRNGSCDIFDAGRTLVPTSRVYDRVIGQP